MGDESKMWVIFLHQRQRKKPDSIRVVEGEVARGGGGGGSLLDLELVEGACVVVGEGARKEGTASLLGGSHVVGGASGSLLEGGGLLVVEVYGFFFIEINL